MRSRSELVASRTRAADSAVRPDAVTSQPWAGVSIITTSASDRPEARSARATSNVTWAPNE